MSQTFAYKSIAATSEGLYKEKGSKFVGYAFPCNSEKSFAEELKKVKSEHRTARHHCYAYAFGPDGEEYRANDDGEPSGTAGRPIHGQIRSFEVSDVGIVVVRYFGGTKLGTSGLIRAYKSTAKDALENARIIEMELTEKLRIVFPPSDTGAVMRITEKFDARIIDQQYSNESELTVEIKLRIAEQIRTALGQIPTLRLDP